MNTTWTIETIAWIRILLQTVVKFNDVCLLMPAELSYLLLSLICMMIYQSAIMIEEYFYFYLIAMIGDRVSLDLLVLGSYPALNWVGSFGLCSRFFDFYGFSEIFSASRDFYGFFKNFFPIFTYFSDFSGQTMLLGLFSWSLNMGKSTKSSTNGVNKSVGENQENVYNPMIEGVRWSEKHSDKIENVWKYLPNWMTQTLVTVAVFLIASSIRGKFIHLWL